MERAVVLHGSPVVRVVSLLRVTFTQWQLSIVNQ